MAAFAPTIVRFMAYALKTIYCRGALGTRVNPYTIKCVWTGEFDLNTLRMGAEIFESGKKKLQIKEYPNTCGSGLSSSNFYYFQYFSHNILQEVKLSDVHLVNK